MGRRRSARPGTGRSRAPVPTGFVPPPLLPAVVVATVLPLASACGDPVGAPVVVATGCVRVEVADLSLSSGPECGVASHPLARSARCRRC